MAINETNALSASWYWKQRNAEVHEVIDELEGLPKSGTVAASDPPPSLATIVTGWHPTDSGVVPSEVHVELLRLGLIPDPYVGFGEHEIQWIADAEWLFGCSFALEDVDTFQSAILNFEGLDTLCDVYLNGIKIVETNNMFREYHHNLSLPDLKDHNALLLHFKSARALAKELELRHGKVRAGSTNLGDPSRVYVRKAQYGWRWDWGPEIMTCGPYRPITITAIRHAVRIQDVWVKSWLVATASEAGVESYMPSLEVDVTLDLLAPSTSKYAIEVSLADANDPGQLLKVTKLPVPLLEEDSTHVVLRVEWPDLRPEHIKPWWPAGMGSQQLYMVVVKLLHEKQNEEHPSKTIDTVAKRIGFRSVRLVEGPLEVPDQYGTGTTFFFEINGERVFLGGSNWIPGDNLLTTLTEDRYRSWLTLLRDGNQTMVRIWGGGIYEPDVFYDICDELGLVVWQDFQFACGVYPGVAPAPAEEVAPKPYPEFVENVRQEAEDNVRRLRHHPCMAVWCGNNEDYQMVLQWGDVPHLPATVIYEDVLPSVVSSLTSYVIGDKTVVQAPYVRGSPYGGKGWDTADPTVGDVHQWNIWGGKELPYQEYGRLGGRFVSEFGIPSFPSLETVKHWMKGIDDSEWYAQSRAMAQHIRAGAYERRFAIVMNENFRNVDAKDFDRYRFNTQVMQSEAVGYAYQIWKREWRGKGKEYCGGVLVWQFNDCWPVVSWALVDYFLRPKPIYYTIARHLAPVTVNILREVVQNRPNDRPKQFYEYGATRSKSANLQIWATNSTRQAVEVTLDIQYFDLGSDWKSVHDFSPAVSSTFTLLPNQTTELLTLACPSPPNSLLRSQVGSGVDGSGSVVVLARLLDPQSGEVIARFVDWPQPFRYLNIPEPKVTLECLARDEGTGDATFRVAVEKPVKCLWLEADGEPTHGQELNDVRWSDNALDVVPGDPQIVVGRGLGGRDVKLTWLRG